MYLNVVQLAESLGVAENVVEGWVRNEGLPAIEDRGRLLFDRAQVVQWAAGRGLVAKAGFLATDSSAAPGSQLERLLGTGGFWRAVPAAAVMDTLGRIINALPGASPQVRTLLAQRLRMPGGVTWAPIGGGLALPHLSARVALGRDSGLLAILFLNDPLPLAEPPPDGQPVTRLFFFIAPTPAAHLELLARLSKALTRGPLRQLVLDAAPDAEILAALGGPGPGAGGPP